MTTEPSNPPSVEVPVVPDQVPTLVSGAIVEPQTGSVLVRVGGEQNGSDE